MFLTFDGLEGRVPPVMLEAGFQYWSAAVLPRQVPWYLLSIQREGSARRQETVFIASESMLVELLGDVDVSSVTGLMRFDARLDVLGAWDFVQVIEVWCDWLLPEGCRLFFRLQGERGLRDASLRRTEAHDIGMLLAKMPPLVPSARP
ncbi:MULTISPECIES: hypothetical protein [unclassified Roseateles]|uniref:hypothetical protein n=1 Tax=unclassified Roseateles TaxID=2626991 RepID=UPI0012E3336E|nr:MULTISPECIES: hypothetical protein [unclassified Roseateles]